MYASWRGFTVTEYPMGMGGDRIPYSPERMLTGSGNSATAGVTGRIPHPRRLIGIEKMRKLFGPVLQRELCQSVPGTCRPFGQYGNLYGRYYLPETSRSYSHRGSYSAQVSGFRGSMS